MKASSVYVLVVLLLIIFAYSVLRTKAGSEHYSIGAGNVNNCTSCPDGWRLSQINIPYGGSTVWRCDAVPDGQSSYQNAGSADTTAFFAAGSTAEALAGWAAARGVTWTYPCPSCQCPQGWTPLGGGSCAAPPSYSPPEGCFTVIETNGASAADMVGQGQACGFYMPAQPCTQCTVPNGWYAREGGYAAMPAGFPAGCDPLSNFAGYGTCQAQHWINSCGGTWDGMCLPETDCGYEAVVNSVSQADDDTNEVAGTILEGLDL